MRDGRDRLTRSREQDHPSATPATRFTHLLTQRMLEARSFPLGKEGAHTPGIGLG